MGPAIGDILPLSVSPLVLYLAMGARAASILGGLKTWMAAHNAAIMTVLLLVLGRQADR